MNNKEKTKRFYSKTHKNKHIKSGQYTVGINEKGFLCSCNYQERECIRECYNLLNKYADKLSENSKGAVCAPTDDNIEDDLEKEIADLQSQNVPSSSKKQFQVIDSGAKNFLFIRTTREDPVPFATMIVKDICDSKELQTRYLIRLVPVEATCKAYITNIKETCNKLLQKHFVNNPRSFSIIYNHRNNANLSRDLVISEVADLVKQTRGDHVVNLNNADISIVIEVIKGIALLAIIPDYLKYKKFNLHSLSGLKKDNLDINVEKNNENINSDGT